MSGVPGFEVVRLLAALAVLIPGIAAAAALLKSDEQIVFIPSIASPGDGDTWGVDVHAWVLERESRTLTLPVFQKVLGLDEDEMTAAEHATFKDRARWFLADNERGKSVSIWLDHRMYPLGRTEADGQLVVRVTLKSEQIARMREEAASPVVPFAMVNSSESGRSLPGEIHLIEPQGLSVISDIDDTIKISEVRDQRALLRNTFIKPFQPVEDMAEAYRAWMTNNGAQFHYVSASPVQLYVPLSDFVSSNGFPAGTFHLKAFRWRNESFFNLWVSPEVYKPGVIEPMFRRLPDRRFILVGDSGEKDPEIYGALARKFPRQVMRILIRDVTNEAADSQRYRAAFRGVDRAKWQVFRDADELPRKLN